MVPDILRVSVVLISRVKQSKIRAAFLEEEDIMILQNSGTTQPMGHRTASVRT